VDFAGRRVDPARAHPRRIPESAPDVSAYLFRQDTRRSIIAHLFKSDLATTLVLDGYHRSATMEAPATGEDGVCVTDIERTDARAHRTERKGRDGCCNVEANRL
jgi:hypothetical protein